MPNQQAHALAEVISFFNTNAGTVSALLTFALVVSTIISIWLASRALRTSNGQMKIMQEQLDVDRKPSVRFYSKGGDFSTWQLFNTGEYPIYMHDGYFAMGSILANAFSLDSFSQREPVKVEPFSSITLPIHTEGGGFGLGGPGNHKFYLGFFYGGTGDTIYTLRVELNVGSTLRDVEIGDQRLLINYDVENDPFFTTKHPYF